MDYLALNKQLWNERTEINYASRFYDVDGFKAAPTPLDPEVLAGLGDLTGKSVLHLQCHFGMDTIRLALAGARDVVGVDFSPRAIGRARELAAELDVAVQFVESDLYALALDRKFDIVFSSYGVIGWLPDLDRWAAVVASHLDSGGQFFLIEGHPTMWMFDEAQLTLKYPYFRQREPLVIPPVTGCYSDPDAKPTHTEYSWPHELGETVTSLIRAGLSIDDLREYAHTVWKAFPFMVEVSPGRFEMPPDKPQIPTLFSIKASKRA